MIILGVADLLLYVGTILRGGKDDRTVARLMRGCRSRSKVVVSLGGAR